MIDEEIFYEGKIHSDWRIKERLKLLISIPLVSLAFIVPFSIPLFIFNFLPYYFTSINILDFFFQLFIILIIIIIIIFFIVFIISNSYLKAYVKNFSFQITENNVIINHGVFRQSRATIPYGRIQNINITSGILDRKYKLFTLNVETAGASGYPLRRAGYGYAKAEGYIPGQKEPLVIETKIKERLYIYSRKKDGIK